MTNRAAYSIPRIMNLFRLEEEDGERKKMIVMGRKGVVVERE